MTIQETIDDAFDRRNELAEEEIRDSIRPAVEQVLVLLESGEQRVSEPRPEGWKVSQWLKQAVRLYFREDGGLWFKSGDRSFKQNFCVADSTIFDVFSFNFIRGSAEAVVRTPNGLALSASTARRLFGDGNPIGKVLSVDDWKLVGEYQVAAVIEDTLGA